MSKPKGDDSNEDVVISNHRRCCADGCRRVRSNLRETCCGKDAHGRGERQHVWGKAHGQRQEPGKVHPLKGDKAEIDKHAGERATVKGTLDGNAVTVQSITNAKKASAPGS